MTRSNTHRRSTLVVALGAVAAILIATTAPASATAVDSSTLVFVPRQGSKFTLWRNGNVQEQTRFRTYRAFPGDFSGQPGTDVFLYNPGPEPDGILHVTPNGSSFTTSFTPKPISGTYQWLVGDFDANGIDDIFWYGPGSAADNLWLFKADGSHTSKSLPVNGNYKPVAINTDGDGDTDIIWYAPGAAADVMWRFGPGGVPTNKALTINGDYVLVPGHFGAAAEGSPQRRLMFWNKDGADSIWTFDTSANHTSAAMPNIDGNSFKPIVGKFTDPDNDAVLFYRADTSSERFISFNDDGSINQLEAPSVKNFYLPEVGDFDGNGYEDIAWTYDGKATIWKFASGGYTQQTVTVTDKNTYPQAVDNYRYPA